MAAVALALLSAAATWALVAADDFGLLIAVGTVALVAGLWVLAQPLPKWIRLAATAAALTALPATAGLRMKWLADSVKPFSSGYPGQRDLPDPVLSLAFEGELPGRGHERLVVSLDASGLLTWKGKNITLADLDEILRVERTSEGPHLVLRADKDAPVQHLAWLMLAGRAHGWTEVRVAARKYADGFYMPSEAQALAAERGREYWPEVDLVFPIRSDEGGTRLRIVGTERKPSMWPPPMWPSRGPRGGGSSVLMPTRLRYELRGRTTDDLRELARWMHDAPPQRIDADPCIQVKFVVAVQNQIRKAGHPPAALVLPDPPPEAVRNAPSLPYPADD